MKSVKVKEGTEKMVKKKKKKVVAKVNKKTVAKVEKKEINPKVDEKTAKKDIKKKAVAKTTIEPPTNFPIKIGKIENPLVQKKRMKKALAVALIRLNSDKAVVANACRNSGIPFKQVNSPEEAKKPILLSKAEWKGTNWASWAEFNKDMYYEAHKDLVEECMPFAKALLKSL